VAVDVAGLLHLGVADVDAFVPQAPHVEQPLGVDVGEDGAEQGADLFLRHPFLAHPAADLLVAQQGDEDVLVLGPVGQELKPFGAQGGCHGTSRFTGVATTAPGRGGTGVPYRRVPFDAAPDQAPAFSIRSRRLRGRMSVHTSST
jgi:hypothetical protein